jgi:tetratricopeptide (TPR) repeat protein
MPSAPSSDPQVPAGRIFALGALLVAAALLAWANSFSGAFVLDDLPAIAENSTIRSWPTAFFPPGDGQTVSGRPLVNASFALNWSLGGESVHGYHALNLAIHALAALALFGLVRRTLRSPALIGRFGHEQATMPAAVIAGLWLLHPLQTESVTYLSQRAESLAGLCLLATLYAATRGTEPGGSRVWSAIAVGACLLGMATKEVMYAAPLLVWLHDRTFFGGTFREVLQRRPRFYAALAATWLLLGWLAWRTGNRGMTAGFGLGISPRTYLLTQCAALVHYVRLAMWPTPLVFDYGTATIDSFMAVGWQALALSVAFVCTIVGVVRRTPGSFLGAWFFLLLAPSSSLIPVATQTVAEHRMYLPLVAVIAAATLTLATAIGARSRWLLIIAALALGLLTFQRNTTYRSALTIWRDTIAKRPDNARAFGELANALFTSGHLAASLPVYERALQLLPRYPKARHNYAGALAAAGRLDEAAAHFELAIAQSPTLADAYYGLGNVRREQRRVPDALACYETALRLRPDFAMAHNNLANLLAAAGRTDEALAHYAAAVRAQPDFPDAEYNWANVLAGAQRPAEALPHYQNALRLAPGFVAAHENLGVTLLLLDRTPEGIAELETALRLDPSRESVRQNLAVARARAAAK